LLKHNRQHFVQFIMRKFQAEVGPAGMLWRAPATARAARMAPRGRLPWWWRRIACRGRTPESILQPAEGDSNTFSIQMPIVLQFAVSIK
jgi:hypothetical protein